MDKISTEIDNIVIAGDLNYDTLNKDKGATLLDLCDIFDFTNLIKSATCLKKNCIPSLVDVIFTNQPRFCFNSRNFGFGIRDCHSIIGVAVRGAPVRMEEQSTKYRGFKNFDQNAFNDDVGQIPFHAAYAFDDVDDIYWAHEGVLSDVIDEHAPIKERNLQASKYTKIGTCPASQKNLAYMGKNNFHSKVSKISLALQPEGLVNTS